MRWNNANFYGIVSMYDTLYTTQFKYPAISGSFQNVNFSSFDVNNTNIKAKQKIDIRNDDSSYITIDDGDIIIHSSNDDINIDATNNLLLNSGNYININPTNGLIINDIIYGIDLPNSGTEGRVFFRLID